MKGSRSAAWELNYSYCKLNYTNEGAGEARRTKQHLLHTIINQRGGSDRQAKRGIFANRTFSDFSCSMSGFCTLLPSVSMSKFQRSKTCIQTPREECSLSRYLSLSLSHDRVRDAPRQALRIRRLRHPPAPAHSVPSGFRGR